MILKLLLNIKILKSTIQVRNLKYWYFFDNMIADILSNKKPNPIITEVLIKGRKLYISLAFIT